MAEERRESKFGKNLIIIDSKKRTKTATPVVAAMA